MWSYCAYMKQSEQATGPLLVSIKDAAQMLSVTTWSVYKLADSGVLDSRYQGRRRYVTAASLRAYVEGLPKTSSESA